MSLAVFLADAGIDIALQPATVMYQVAQSQQPASIRSSRLSDIYTAIQQDRTIRMWRHAADKVRSIWCFHSIFIYSL
jgi:hypothetical protein